MADRFIVANSGAFHEGSRIDWEFGPLVAHAVELAGVSGRAPKVGYLPTAHGDQQSRIAQRLFAANQRGWQLNPLVTFLMPNVADPREYLLDQDVIWVDGGSVANLLAIWRVHGLDAIMREAWEQGIVLAGTSAGSICWHLGGSTDSFGPELRPITNGLGFLPYGNGVHYNATPLRRAVTQAMVARADVPEAYSTDNGVGLVYNGTELVDVVADRRDAYGWHTYMSGDGVAEDRITPRLLPEL